MTFDTWIDAVNIGVRTRLGTDVRTEELSFDSAMWTGPAGTVVAELGNDGATMSLSSKGLARSEFAYRDTAPDVVADRIVSRLR